MRVRRWLGVLAAITTLVATGGPVALAFAPPSSLGIRLLDAPIDRRNDPRAFVYIIDRVGPGAAITRHLEVTNDSDTPHHIELYPDAASITGGAFVVAVGRTVSDLTSWITMTPNRLEMAPHEKRTITASIAVPADASSGERYGVLLAEAPAIPGEGIRQTTRVGIRVYLSIGPGAEPASNFTIDSLTASRDATGAPQVTAQIHNTGGRALDMRGTLRLSNGPGGLSAGPFTARLGSTLAPGDTEPVIIPLDKALPPGPWDARIELQSGLLDRVATATITFPNGAGSSGRAVKANAVHTSSKLVLYVLIGLGGLLLLGLLLLLLRRRRREPRPPAPPRSRSPRSGGGHRRKG